MTVKAHGFLVISVYIKNSKLTNKTGSRLNSTQKILQYENFRMKTVGIDFSTSFTPATGVLSIKQGCGRLMRSVVAIKTLSLPAPVLIRVLRLNYVVVVIICRRY